MDQHHQRRQSLLEDGTPQILLVPPNEKKLGHHITLTIDTLNYKEKTYVVNCQIRKHLSYHNLGHHLTLSIDTFNYEKKSCFVKCQILSFNFFALARINRICGVPSSWSDRRRWRCWSTIVPPFIDYILYIGG